MSEISDASDYVSDDSDNEDIDNKRMTLPKFICFCNRYINVNHIMLVYEDKLNDVMELTLCYNYIKDINTIKIPMKDPAVIKIKNMLELNCFTE